MAVRLYACLALFLCAPYTHLVNYGKSAKIVTKEYETTKVKHSPGNVRGLAAQLKCRMNVRCRCALWGLGERSATGAAQVG